MRHKHSDYMHWSKTQSRARFNLATSGVAPFPFRELPVDLEKLEINGDNSYGYSPLQEAIAAHHGVDPECGSGRGAALAGAMFRTWRGETKRAGISLIGAAGLS